MRDSSLHKHTFNLIFYQYAVEDIVYITRKNAKRKRLKKRGISERRFKRLYNDPAPNCVSPTAKYLASLIRRLPGDRSNQGRSVGVSAGPACTHKHEYCAFGYCGQIEGGWVDVAFLMGVLDVRRAR